jgi:RNA polymerase sigma-70 factor (ECF subfamily)
MRLEQATQTNEPSTDEELVELVLAGQGEVFARLYERYYLRAYRLAYGMTGQREAAEDLTQEIFLRTYQKLHQFRGEARFATWFYRLTTNHCLRYRQRARRNPEEVIDDLEQALPQPCATQSRREAEAKLFQQQTQTIIHKALLSLKPELRLVVVLRNLEGLSYEEIAERMDCSVGTVGTWLHRAHKLLARKLAGLRGEY